MSCFRPAPTVSLLLFRHSSLVIRHSARASHLSRFCIPALRACALGASLLGSPSCHAGASAKEEASAKAAALCPWRLKQKSRRGIRAPRRLLVISQLFSF